MSISEIPYKNGIFVQMDCNDQNCTLLITSIYEMLSNSERDVEIDTVMEYKSLGYRVFFNTDSVTEYFLKQKSILMPQKVNHIYSLTTQLVIHDIIPQSRILFKESLKKAFSTLGTVLDVSPISACPSYQMISNGRWRIVLNIPEIEYLNAEIAPGEALLKDLAPNKMITFCCSMCNNYFHLRSKCPKLQEELLPTSSVSNETAETCNSQSKGKKRQLATEDTLEEISREEEFNDIADSISHKQPNDVGVIPNDEMFDDIQEIPNPSQSNTERVNSPARKRLFSSQNIILHSRPSTSNSPLSQNSPPSIARQLGIVLQNLKIQKLASPKTNGYVPSSTLSPIKNVPENTVIRILYLENTGFVKNAEKLINFLNETKGKDLRAVANKQNYDLDQLIKELDAMFDNYQTEPGDNEEKSYINNLKDRKMLYFDNIID